MDLGVAASLPREVLKGSNEEIMTKPCLPTLDSNKCCTKVGRRTSYRYQRHPWRYGETLLVQLGKGSLTAVRRRLGSHWLFLL